MVPGTEGTVIPIDRCTTGLTYDPAGNRLTTNGTPYLYDAANRLTRAGRMTYAYDKTGNRTAQHGSLNQSMAFTYDGANRLAAVDRAQTLNLSLSPGWNLVANPFLAGPADIPTALDPLQLPADYDQVSRYNGARGTFEHFVGAAPYDQFNTLDPGRGFQLYVTHPSGAAVSLPQAGPSSAQTVSLNTGWNLIGSPRSEPLSAAQALAPLVQGVDYDSVMELDPSTGGYRSAAAVRPGIAYWLHTLRPAVLTIPAAASHAVTYAYDGDGRRVSKTVNGVTTRFLYDGLEILAELDASGSSVLTSYVHGTGMTPQELENLFVPFFTTKATAQKGTGLGLYVIQRIMERHGGTITAASKPGAGTTFKLRLPAAVQAAAAGATPVAGEANSEKSAAA